MSIHFHREASYPDYLARIWEVFHDGAFTPDTLPDKPDTLTPLPAFVNEGRWLATCDCGNGISLPVEPREDLLCPACETWHSVTWPADRSEIEAHLLAMPGHRLNGSQQRHWRPE